GVFAALTRPNGTPLDSVPEFAGFLAGSSAFLLLRRADRAPVRPGNDPRSFDRRRFLIAGAVGAVVAALAGGAGNALGRRFLANASRADVAIPLPLSPAAASSGTDLPVPGLEPFFTPNDRFYRGDTALLAPAVMTEDWRLRVHGMVDRELAIGYRQLLERPLIERDVTPPWVSQHRGGRDSAHPPL